MSKKIIIKFIRGDYSRDREKQILRWITGSPKRIRQYKKLKTKSVISLLNSDNHIDYTKQHKTSNWKRIYKVAALIVLLITTTFFMNQYFIDSDKFLHDQLITIVTKKGERKEIFLVDSTKVILNANSELSYFDFSKNEKRKVTLSGEAFFEVKRDEEHPFIIDTKDGVEIKVLGTVFNVKSYPKDTFVETTLVSGKVKVEEKNQRKAIELKPSQKATYFSDHKTLIVEEVDVKHSTSWTKGVLVYNETPILEVFEDLERTYDVIFDVKAKEILEYKYSGVFDNMSIDEVLDVFQLSSPIKCKRLKNKIIVKAE